MKLAIISVFFLYALIEASSGQVVVGTLIAARTTPIECVEGNHGFRCNTCTSALLCSDAVTLATITCSSPESFCDSSTNQCTSVKPTTCTTSTFKCPAEGYFPDAQNCDKYYFCTADKAVEEYECPVNYVFDITIKGCKRMVYPALDCITMKCQKASEYIVYSKDPSIFVFCDNALMGHMFKCPTSQEFDKTNSNCKFTCKREGYYAGTTKSDAYFCYKEGVTFKYTTVKCPADYEFNESFTCIKTPVAAAATNPNPNPSS